MPPLLDALEQPVVLAGLWLEGGGGERALGALGVLGPDEDVDVAGRARAAEDGGGDPPHQAVLDAGRVERPGRLPDDPEKGVLTDVDPLHLFAWIGFATRLFSTIQYQEIVAAPYHFGDGVEYLPRCR